MNLNVTLHGWETLTGRGRSASGHWHGDAALTSGLPSDTHRTHTVQYDPSDVLRAIFETKRYASAKMCSMQTSACTVRDTATQTLCTALCPV